MENKQLVGEVFTTKSWGDLKIIDYNGNRKVRVKFVQTGYEVVASLLNIRKGSVRDRLLPSVYGVGIIGAEPIVDKDGRKLKEYELWCSMLQLVYDSKKHIELPTYTNCSVSENFKYFPYFKEWCNNQIGANALDDKGNPFALDKDILIKGNKQYGEDVCVFIPRELNNLVTNCSKSRGDSVIGVCYSKAHKKYLSKVRKYGKLTHLGHFDTEIEAFIVYKEAKESHIKTLANKWKDQIDPRVYEVLMNWEIEITD